MLCISIAVNVFLLHLYMGMEFFRVYRNLEQKTWVQSLGWKDSLEKEMATHSISVTPMVYLLKLMSIDSSHQVAKGDSFLNFKAVHCFTSGSNCCFLTCTQVSQKADKVSFGVLTQCFDSFFALADFFCDRRIRTEEPLPAWKSYLNQKSSGIRLSRVSFLLSSFFVFCSPGLQHDGPLVRKAVEEENCCFGTVDTWLLHKLTKGSEFATDFSNASTTGLFDPYEMCWSKIITSLLSIPLSLLPPVKDTSKESVDEQKDLIFVCLWQVADQQSAMFGECCFQTGDVKLTMGTGTFLDINTGNKPQQSVGGFYPLIGWKIGQEVVCLAEGNAGDTGTAIAWAQQLDLFTDAAETEKMAKSLEDSEGVYFVPSFSGLQAPLNDPCACASFMGLKPSTNKYHLVRAILESIAFRNKQLYEMMQKEIHIPVRKIRADGGVCKNSFVMQMTSDLINETIDRPVHVDMSCLGAASLAGLAVGFWSDKEELKKLRQSEMVFKPQKKWQEYEMNMGNWVKAVKRSMHWYKT
ncbi:hypothetical protein FD754_001371 [Muntiacus muntjak]|uniref:glycerol kinase n=1 Tax=Muntiacus muntjak TaxID=9888 RepID=A0A5N3W957_MUNMU|nr:hypothetical protein FD754_001371 [Muntiacus muntjak]